MLFLFLWKFFFCDSLVEVFPQSEKSIVVFDIRVKRYHTHCNHLVVLFYWFGLVSLFNGISNLFRLFNAKAILPEEQLWYYLTHSWEDKGVHTFPKGIFPKVNVIAWLEYELAYYDSAVQRFNHYTTRTPPIVLLSLVLFVKSVISRM